MSATPPPPSDGAAVAPARRSSGRAGTMTRAMQLGLHVIALLLVAVGVARAIGDEVPPVLAVLAGLVFLAWYAVGPALGARLHEARHVYSWAGTLAVIWIGTIAISAEFIWLAFLLWLLAGRFFTLRGAVIFSAVVFGLVIYAPIWHHGSAEYATIFGPLIGAIFAVGIARGYLQLLQDAAERDELVRSLTRTQQEIVDLQDELVLTQRYSGMAAERTRIARDIHDTVAQSLPSIRLLAHAAATAGDPDGMRRALGQVETLAAEGITDIRRILAALTPAELDQGALGSALARMLGRIHDDTGIVTELHVDDTLPGLSSPTEVALLRTAQSALANVRRHSQASRVVVSLIDDGDAVRLDIIDDGRGFVVSAQRHLGGDGNSYGLGFIAGRLRELGGGLDVASTPGTGTELSAYLPIHHLAKEI